MYIAAGVVVGLALVTKLSALPVPLTLIVLVILAGIKAHQSVKDIFAKLGLAVGGLIIGAGWWFTFIIYQLNKVAELGWLAGLLAPIIQGDGSDVASNKVVTFLSAGFFYDDWLESLTGKFNEWVVTLFSTLWTPYPYTQGWILTIALGISIVTLAGLVKVFWQQHRYRAIILFLAVYTLILLILPLVRLALLGSDTVAGQGQHLLFPAIGALTTFIGLGLWGYFPGSKGWLAGILLGAALLVWSIFHSVAVFPVVNPVPVKTVPPVLPASAQAREIHFDDVTLKGYELFGLTDDGQCCAQPVLRVDLYWLVHQRVGEDYRLEISLIDSAGNRQSTWYGYTANGRYPSRAWEWGDIIAD
jgi:hypothetical protein